MATDDLSMNRRTVLTLTSAAMTGPVLAGGSGGTQSENDDSTATSDPTETSEPTESNGGGSGSESFGGWMEDVGNYDSVVDETGQSEVTVMVGAEGNGGPYAYDPPAITADSGTTVVWEWTGEGSPHNVVDNDGAFESDMLSEQGATFEHTFEGSGTYKYYCAPHKKIGMKGVVVVE